MPEFESPKLKSEVPPVDSEQAQRVGNELVRRLYEQKDKERQESKENESVPAAESTEQESENIETEGAEVEKLPNASASDPELKKGVTAKENPSKPKHKVKKKTNNRRDAFFRGFNRLIGGAIATGGTIVMAYAALVPGIKYVLVQAGFSKAITIPALSIPIEGATATAAAFINPVVAGAILIIIGGTIVYLNRRK